METAPLTCRIREDSGLARLAARRMGTANMAVTVGRTIYLYHATRAEFLGNPRWVNHEICHLLQFRRYGFFGFLWRYGWETMQQGYRGNKYEKEALAAENDGSLLGKVCFTDC